MNQSTALTIHAAAEAANPGRNNRNAASQRPFDENQPTFVKDILDPYSLGLLPPVPLIPEAILRKHHVFIATDTRYRSAARLMVALWREDRDLPIGTLRDLRTGRRRKLGSRINAVAGRAGANFITSEVARLAERELLYRELGAVIEEDRLKHNLLSSQPLCFNLFGPLKLDRDLATAVFAELLPSFIAEVTSIYFESNPLGRGNPLGTADGTAADVIVCGRTPSGKRMLVMVEVKLTEGCHEPLPRGTGRQRFDVIAASTDLFVDHADPALRQNPTQQLFRQSCLATAMLQHGLADAAVHMLIAPQDNHLAANAAALYRRQLRDADAGPIPFVAPTLERFIAAIAAAGAHDLARALHRRYTDTHLIVGELELELAEAGAGMWFDPPEQTSRDATSKRSKSMPA